MPPPDGEIAFSLEEMLGVIGDLVRVAEDLRAGGEEVNAFIVDQVVNQLVDRVFGGE